MSSSKPESRACEDHDEVRALLAIGQDPSDTKKDRKREDQERRRTTFAAHAKLFATKAERVGRASSTMAKTEWLLEMAIADFGKKPICEITAPMILKCILKVETKGNHETAKRLRAKIGDVFCNAVTISHAETDPTYTLRDALIQPAVTFRAVIIEPVALGGSMRAIDAFHDGYEL